MRDTQVAEFILGLFTSRDRAAATVGDLVESAPAHGALWLWLCILRTALSLLWRDLVAEPSFMAGLALRGLLVNASLYLALGLVLAVIFIFFAAFGMGPPAFLEGANDAFSPHYDSVFFGALFSALLIPVVAVEFQTGRWIARRARHREVAACVAFLIVGRFVKSVVALLIGVPGAHPPTQPSVAPAMQVINVLGDLLFVAPLFVGAIWVRRRPVRRAAP